MATVAEAFVTLRPDLDDFEKDAKSGLGSKLGGIAKVAGAAFGAAGIAAGVYGIKAAASFEQTTIAFEGILGDVGKAKDLLGQLRTFAAKTPFEFAGLTDSAKSLLAVGFEAKDVIPTMTTLGNVAATLGVGEAEIQGVVRALGQMKGKGKASAEELNQISEQVPGFSAVKAVAEGLGITVEEAFKKMQAGAIPADEAISAILTGMEKFPGASGAMDRQSKTLNGAMSTLKDTLTGVAIDFITPYLPAITAGIIKFSDFMTNTLIPAISRVIDFVKLHWPEIQRVINSTVEGIRSFVEPIVGALQSLWENFGDNILEFMRRSWGPLKQFIEGALQAVRGVIQVVTSLIQGDWSGVWEGIKNIFFGVWEAIQGSVKLAFERLRFLIGVGLEIVGSVIKGAWSGIVDLFHWDSIIDGGRALLGWLNKLGGWIAGAIGDVKDAFIAPFKAAFEKIKELWDDGPGRIPGIAGFVRGAVNTVLPGAGFLPGFATGGTVPGPIGSPMLAVVHGGEQVLTPQQQFDSRSVVSELQALRQEVRRQSEQMVRLART